MSAFKPTTLVKTIANAHARSVLCLAIELDDDGRGVMVSGSSDKTVKVWDIDMSSSGAENSLEPTVILQATIEASGTSSEQEKGVMDVLITGKYIITAWRDSKIRIYDRENLALLQVIDQHTGAVNGLALGPEGDAFVSVGADKLLAVWNLRSGAEPVSLKFLHTLKVGLVCVAWQVSLTLDTS
jgi:WD40 repeat protein